MNKEQLVEEIQVIARDIFAKPDLVISDDLNASKVDTWTSLSFMQFLTAIEDKYGFKFKMMELLQMRDMEAVVKAVQGHVMD